MFEGLIEALKVLPALKGPNLWVFLAIVFCVILFFWGRHYIAGGNARLAANEARHDDAVGILREWQQQESQRIAALEADKKADTRYDQDYRHALGGLANAALLGLDVAHMIFVRIKSEWQGMPEEIKEDIRNVPTGQELSERHPLPQRKMNDE